MDHAIRLGLLKASTRTALFTNTIINVVHYNKVRLI